MSSPYVKAKARLEALGYQVGKTEYWNSFAKCRVDLFSCIDAVCMRPFTPLLAIQVTDITSVSKRMEKAHKIAMKWVSTGNRFEVWGFTPKSKKPPRIMEMLESGEWDTKQYDPENTA
jgi:hypothetical protein